MKRIHPLRFFAAVALVAALAACKNDPPQTPLPPTEPEPVYVKMYATHDPLDGTTRTQLGNNIVSWSSSDNITVWTPDGKSSSVFGMISSTGAAAQFGGETLEQAGRYVALYPGGWETRFNGIALTLTIPERMAAEPDKLLDGVNPSLATGDVAEMRFRNLCGLLKFRVTGQFALCSMTFEGVGGEPLSGAASIDVTKDVPTLRMTGTSTKKTLTTETQLSEDVARSFYLVLPAGDYDGFRVTFADNTGDSYTTTYGKPVTVGQGRITELPETLVYADQLDRVAKPLDGDGTANSYIVPAAGSWYFNCTVKGNSQESVGTVAGVRMVWTEKQGLITDLQLQNGLLVFTAGAEAGNTLVAAVDAAGTVLWSWHIWCTGGEVPADKTVQNFTEKRIRMMDRFLGAHSVTGKEATLYEFGRKDPFSNAETLYVDGRSTSIYYKWYSYATRDEAGADNAAAILYATRHPDTYITGGGAGGWIPTRDQTLWGDVNGWDEKYAVGMNTFSGGKTIYDPCPVGYRVPNVWSFSGFSKESVLYPAWNGGWWLKGTPDDTDGIFFAGVGYWLNYSNTVWDAKGTYIWRDGMTRYSHTWCASSALRGSGNAATFRVYHENEHNCDVYSGDTRPGSYGMPVRCVRDNYAY